METSKSQATSVSMDMDAVNQAHFNGDVNGASQDDENAEETMEIEGTGHIQKTAVSSRVEKDCAVDIAS